MNKNSLTGKTATTIANHEYVRLNDIADRFPPGKKVDNWMRQQSTKELVEAFLERDQEPFKVVKGRMADHQNSDEADTKKFIQQGTWAHPVIAQNFLEWCQKSPNKSSDSVYLICAVGVNMTKIGITHNANKRLAALQIGSPIGLELFRVEQSSMAEDIESRAHKLASKWHSHGEWFKLSGHEASLILNKAIKQVSVEAQNECSL